MTVLGDDQLSCLARSADPEAQAVIDALVVALGGVNANRWLSDEATRRQRYGSLTAAIIGRTDPGEPIVDAFLKRGGEIDGTLTDRRNTVLAGQRFFEQHGVAIITVLFHQALPEAYLGRRGVQVLDLTGELGSSWSRRIVQTGQFLINVLTPDETLLPAFTTTLHSGHSAATAVRRVRLLHAATRALILAQSTKLSPSATQNLRVPHGLLWHERLGRLGPNEDRWALPICQEDLLATLTTFTTMTFEGLEKLGIRPSDEERAAYHFVWNVIGWHLGIGDETSLKAARYTPPARPANFARNLLLPLTADEMDDLTAHLRTRLQSETEQGRHLTKVLVNKLSTPLPAGVRPWSPALVRYLIGDDKSDQLGVDRGGLLALGARATPFLDEAAALVRNHPLGQGVVRISSSLLTRYAMRAFINATDGDGGLEIDDAVAVKWGLEPRRESDEL